MIQRPGEVRLDVDRLLTIDIAAEVRKLAQAQLEGPWQLPVELVRRALRDGATSVDVRFERGRLIITAQGDRIDPAVPEVLATLASDDAVAEAAHAAVLAIENADQFGLLALRGVEARSVRFTAPTTAGEVAEVTIAGGRARARVHASPDPGSRRGSVIVLEGAEFDVRQARRELTRRCRLCPKPITVDGRTISNRTLEPSFAVADLPTEIDATLQGFRGRVFVRADGETPVVWVLRHGLLATHLTLTAGPAVELALEVAAVTAPQATREDLRVAVDAAAPALLTATVEVLDTLSRTLGLTAAARARVAELALQASKLPALAPRVARMPLFEVLDDGLPTGRVSLVELRAAARSERGRNVVLALGPGDDPRDHECHGRVFLLDESVRAWLSDSLDLVARPPNRRVSPGLGARLRRATKAMRARLSTLLPRSRSVPRDAWSEGELALLSSLGSMLGAAREVALVRSGVPRWRGRTLLLPRSHPDVLAAVAASRDDPAWVYPAALALVGPQLPAREARRGWTMRAWARD